MLGFIKRASQYGYSEREIEYLLKQAYGLPSNFVPNTPGSLAAPIATSVTGGKVPESLKPEYQSNSQAGMMSGSNFYSSPQPAQSAAAAPAANPTPAPAPVQAGPSDAQLAKIMGSYNPKSKLDQTKATRIRELYGQGTTSPSAIYADKAYSGITPKSIRAGGAPQPISIPTKTASMNTQQHSYIYGFVKRAMQYGFSEQQALNIFKNAAELKGDQHKLDVDKDGKIEASDLRKLRQRKQAAFMKQSDLGDAMMAGANYIQDKVVNPVSTFAQEKIVAPVKQYMSRPDPFDPANRAQFDKGAKGSYIRERALADKANSAAAGDVGTFAGGTGTLTGGTVNAGTVNAAPVARPAVRAPGVTAVKPVVARP